MLAALEFGMTRTILVLCIFLPPLHHQKRERVILSVSGGRAECVKRRRVNYFVDCDSQ